MFTKHSTYGQVLLIAACLALLATRPSTAQVSLVLDSVQLRWPNITASVSVECNGQPDFTMTSQDFLVRENGELMQPLSVDYTSVLAPSEYSVALVLDASGSTSGTWNAGIIAGAQAFVGEMDGVKDEACVIFYSGAVTIMQAMTTIKPLLMNGVGQLPASGLGAVWDGAFAGIVEVVNNGVNSPGFIIVINDSPDNASTNTAANVISEANRQGIDIYTIGCGTGYDPGINLAATLTGGQFYNALSPSELPAIYRMIENSIMRPQQICNVRYPSHCPDGGTRNLEVELVNFCGGSDSDTQSFAVPLIPSLFTPVELEIPEITVMAGENFAVPLNLKTALNGLRFPSCTLELKYDPAKLTFISAGAAPGQILDGIPLTVTGGAGSIRVSVQGDVVPAGPGELMNFLFEASTPLDTVYCQLSIQQFSFIGGCLNANLDPGGVLIDVSPNPVITTNGPVNFCDGEDVVLSAPAGYAGYQWSTGDTSRSITVSVSGTYEVTVTTTSGKYGTSPPVVVTSHPPPNPAIQGSGSRNFCEGKSIVLSVVRPSDYTSIQWSNNAVADEITVTQSGEFRVTVTDIYGCVGTSDVVVVVVFPNSIDLGQPDSLTFCEGDTLELDAGPDFLNYLWSTSDTLQRLQVTRSGSYSVTAVNTEGCIYRSDTINVSFEALPEPQISASGSTDLCPGESIRLEVTENFAGYLWSTGERTKEIVVDSPGMYSVEVTSPAGCSATSNEMIVSMPSLPVIDPPGPATFCKGGSVTLDAGVGFRSYVWSNGATTQTVSVTKGGVYSVSVTKGRCTMTSAGVRVTEVSELAPTITLESGDSLLCEGEMVVLDAGEFKTYQWSNGDTTRRIAVTSTGSYYVRVSDVFGCSGSSSPLTVTVFPNPEPHITVIGDTVLCEGETVMLDAGDGYAKYAWSNGSSEPSISVAQSGVYHVKVTTSAGCEGVSEDILINVLPAPTVPVITRNGESLESSAAASYQWYIDGEVLHGETARTIIITAEGKYSVLVTNGHGCSAVSDDFEVTTTVIDRLPNICSLTVFPEPNPGMVHISITTEYSLPISIQVTDAVGRVIMDIRDDDVATTHFHHVNLGQAPSGLYMLRITAGTEIWTRKIIRL